MPLARIHVDFNELDEDGRLYTLPEDSDQELHLGSQVVLCDDEGNTASGHVVEVTDRGRMIVEMTSGSWRSTPALVNPARVHSEEFFVVLSTGPLPRLWPTELLVFARPHFHYKLSSVTGNAPETSPETVPAEPADH